MLVFAWHSSNLVVLNSSNAFIGFAFRGLLNFLLSQEPKINDFWIVTTNEQSPSWRALKGYLVGSSSHCICAIRRSIDECSPAPLVTGLRLLRWSSIQNFRCVSRSNFLKVSLEIIVAQGFSPAGVSLMHNGSCKWAGRHTLRRVRKELWSIGLILECTAMTPLLNWRTETTHLRVWYQMVGRGCVKNSDLLKLFSHPAIHSVTKLWDDSWEAISWLCKKTL